MIYEAQCQKCSEVHEYISSVADRDITPSCCGVKTVKGIFTPPQVGAMNWGREKSFTMTDGTFIETGQEYKAYMKKNNKIPYDEGCSEAEHVKNNKKKEFDKQVLETTKRSYEQVVKP